jgi:membrane fusion protein, multidrug efflux system
MKSRLSRHFSRRRSRGFLVALLTACAALAACSGGEEANTKPQQGAASSPPKQVGVVTVQPERLAIEAELPGRTTARMIAEIRPQIGGLVQKRLFAEGALVKEGDVLYQIDPATTQAAYRSAQAAVKKAESTVAAARSTARRNAELVKLEAVSRQVDDDAQAAAQQAEADLGVARAALETARINLGFTRIAAPISGRVGLSTVTPGALVTATQTDPLTTVQQLDPINVDVTQSSADLLRLQRELADGRLQRAGENAARIRLLLEDGSAYPHEGRLTFSGITVNTGTGAVTLRASVPNPEGLLLPGMYARAVLQEGVDQQGLLVPQQAVTRSATGEASLLLVNANNKVVQRQLTINRAIGKRWQVTSGLQPGDRVIVEGSLRAKVGDTVQAVAVSLADIPELPAVSAAAASAAGPAAGASAAAAAR